MKSFRFDALTIILINAVDVETLTKKPKKNA